MRVAVVSAGDNVGKTVVAHYLLAPRMPGATVTLVGPDLYRSAGPRVRGTDFGAIYDRMLVASAAVVLVEAEDFGTFTGEMRRQLGSHEGFDAFVVPALPGYYGSEKTLASVSRLAAIGVPAGKIYVVLNKLEQGHSALDAYGELFRSYSDTPGFFLSADAFIWNHPAYEYLRSVGEGTFLDLLEETDPDYRETAGQRSADEAAERRSFQRALAGVQTDLERTFGVLFGQSRE